MTDHTAPTAKSIFMSALDYEAGTERDAFLEGACQGDQELRQRVGELLVAHEQEASYLAGPAIPGTVVTSPAPVIEQPGDTIGPYKLLQQIGEGGMGVVYMAEQTDPVARRVALKIIKPGMDTRQVIARFEAERQALAMMDHPNIAKVLDAGTTETGRPYFVMELVKGIPVTQYCDQQHLTVKERLELFLPICQAIQHAHHKGVIHRDVKPTNILVARYDGQPVPKVIDFGVAKAVSQRLTEKTMFTHYGQIVGTIEYMSPEQAEFNQLDIDTRSDIYSLGVLLYELLTGETPFDKQRLRSAAFDELLRIIREEEPPRPSTKLSSSQSLPNTAVNRKVEPHKLSLLVRGELDWIVMKALEKDRGRRYETASAFAADVMHYLNDEAVVACPPSAGYRFRKFARRNKAAMATTAAVCLSLIAGIAGTTWQAIRATQERDRAVIAESLADDEARRARDAQRQAEEAKDRQAELRIEAQEQTRIANEALADATQQRDRAAANFVLARSAVDEFLNRVAEEELLEDPGLHELRQKLLESGVGFYEEFTRDEANASELLLELAGAHYRIGRIREQLDGRDAALPSFEKSIELFEELRESGDHSLDVRLGLATAYHAVDRDDDTVVLCEEILETDPQHVETRRLLGSAFQSLAFWGTEGELLTFSGTTDSDLRHGVTYFHKAVRIREQLVRDFPDNPRFLSDLGNTLGNLGFLLRIQRQEYDAIPLFQRAVSYLAQAYNQDARWGESLCNDLRHLALAQRDVGDDDAALESFERLVEFRRRLVFDGPRVPEHKAGLYEAWISLGRHQRYLNQADEAERSFQAAQEVLENMPRKEAHELFDLAVVYSALAAGADQPEQQRFADQAMESLAAAVDDGYRDEWALESTQSLDVLRERGDFRQLAARVKQEAETLELENQLSDGRQSLQVIRELIGNDPDAAQHQVALATALHSIAMVQMGIGQLDEAEQSLNEALELHRKITNGGDDSAFRRYDAIKPQLTLGQLYGRLGRWPEAHAVWQACLEALRELAEETRQDTELQFQIGLLEITISNDYGSLGLWREAAEHSLRSVQFERTPDREIVWECRHASLLPGRLPDDRLQAYIKRLEQHVPGNLEPASPLDPRQHLVWTAGFFAHEALPPDRFLELMQPRVNAGLVRFWDQLTMALAQLRAGQPAAAIETLQKSNADWTRLEKASTLSAAYLLALATHATGDADRAGARLRQAEDLYRDYCRRTMTSTQSELAAPYRTLWWELPAAQALRREAREAIMDSTAADPWQHLIQARGYRIIGETDKADAERAAALAAAQDDPHVWLAHFELLDQWGEIARAEWEQVDWDRIIELAGDDPTAWTLRGCWHAEHGRFDPAAADFSQAIDLFPAEPGEARPARRPAYWQAMHWDEVYAPLRALRPDDGELPCERGLYLAGKSEFSEAFAAFSDGTLGDVPGRRWHQSALLMLITGEHAAYRGLCEKTVEYFRDREFRGLTAFQAARLVSAGSQSGVAAETLAGWSDALWKDGQCSVMGAWLAGACSYRADRYQEAIDRLRRAHETSGRADTKEQIYFLMAMAHHQQGSHDVARQWYDMGVAALDKWTPANPDLPTALDPDFWLRLNLRYREATALLGISPTETPLEIARETEPEPDK